jgi:hypothetical protein
MKHWLDWLAVGISILSLAVSGMTAYHTVIVQRDDIRLVVGDALNVRQDGSDLLLARDQEFTFNHLQKARTNRSTCYNKRVGALADARNQMTHPEKDHARRNARARRSRRSDLLRGLSLLAFGRDQWRSLA